MQHWDGAPFGGAKIALLCGDALVAYLRDNKPGIPWPGHWDLAGGGREGAESPDSCALREAEEEFGLCLGPERVRWRRAYPGWNDPTQTSWFLAARITPAEVAAIRFGDEGQHWELMPVTAFLAHPRRIPHLAERLRDCLAEWGTEHVPRHPDESRDPLPLRE